MTSSMLILN